MAAGGFVFHDHAFVNIGGMLKSASSQSDTDYCKESFEYAPVDNRILESQPRITS